MTTQAESKKGARCPEWCGVRACDGNPKRCYENHPAAFKCFNSVACQNAGRCLNPAPSLTPREAPRDRAARKWTEAKPGQTWERDDDGRLLLVVRVCTGPCGSNRPYGTGAHAHFADGTDAPESWLNSACSLLVSAPEHAPKCERTTHPNSAHPCDCPAVPAEAPGGGPATQECPFWADGQHAWNDIGIKIDCPQYKSCGCGAKVERSKPKPKPAPPPLTHLEELAREYCRAHGWAEGCSAEKDLAAAFKRRVREVLADLHDKIKKLDYAWTDQLFAEAEARWLGSPSQKGTP